MQMPTIKSLRTEMGISQRLMAGLLGVSLKAVQSYEQGWRQVPPHVERLLILETALHRGSDLLSIPRCWELHECDPSLRVHCPSYRIPHGGFCWFVTGTLCHGEPSAGWAAKRARCLKCTVLQMLLRPPPGRNIDLSRMKTEERLSQFDRLRRELSERAAI